MYICYINDYDVIVLLWSMMLMSIYDVKDSMMLVSMYDVSDYLWC